MSLQRVHDILNYKDSDRYSKYVHAFITALISLNVLMVILETEPGLYEGYGVFFWWFQNVSLAIFACEYGLRLATHQKSEGGLVRFAVSPMMLVDIIVIVSLLLPLIMTVGSDTISILWMLRILRLFSIFKLVRISQSMRDMVEVAKKTAADMGLAFFILFILLILASSMMYHAEREAQPDVFSSIPSSMWWGVVTLTTVGYGDTYPITVAGKIIATVVVLLGVGVYAIPTGIVASAFVAQRRARAKKDGYCKHCGKSLD